QAEEARVEMPEQRRRLRLPHRGARRRRSRAEQQHLWWFERHGGSGSLQNGLLCASQTAAPPIAITNTIAAVRISRPFFTKVGSAASKTQQPILAIIQLGKPRPLL